MTGTKNPLQVQGADSENVGGNSAEANLGKDSLTGEQLGGQTDNKAEHGQAAIPGFGETNESEAGGVVSHGETFQNVAQIVTALEACWSLRSAQPLGGMEEPWPTASTFSKPNDLLPMWVVHSRSWLRQRLPQPDGALTKPAP
jgi:hypothetical protein